MRAPRLAYLAILGAACAPDPDTTCGPDARSPCAAPLQDASYYADQGQRYFDTLDGAADPASQPTYAPWVARWEWPPWLLLTGYGAEMITAVDAVVLAIYPDTTVPDRDCRGFDTQPFGRCRVVMQIDGKPCPIYEEFTFNDAGEVTFVEAWSDLPGLFPSTPDDPWAEAPGVGRLSTRIPGLGSPSGDLDLDGDAMTAAAAADADVATFVRHAEDFWPTWTETYLAAGDDFYDRGCGW